MLANAGYIVLLSLWEANYIYHYFGTDGLYPFYILLAWVFVLGGIARETKLYGSYWVMYTLVGLGGMYILAGAQCALVGLEYLAAMFFGTFVTMMFGGFDETAEEE